MLVENLLLKRLLCSCRPSSDIKSIPIVLDQLHNSKNEIKVFNTKLIDNDPKEDEFLEN